MKTGRNRLARKDRFTTGARLARRLGRRLRWAALLAALASWPLGAGLRPGRAPAAPRPPPRQRRRPAQDSSSAPMRSAGATWYGPGLYGNQTACGQTLRPDTIGVAHRNLPCGTTVKFVYHGHAAGHPGDRPRPLRQRPRLGPDQRRPRSARNSKASARSATRSPSATPDRRRR